MEGWVTDFFGPARFSDAQDIIAKVKNHLDRVEVKEMVVSRKLSYDESFALCLYTLENKALFSQMNKACRENLPEKAKYATFLRFIESGLKKVPRFSGVAFRVMDSRLITKDYFRGASVELKQLTSVSKVLNKGLFYCFAANMGADGDHGVLLVVHVEDAPDIEVLNLYREREVLLPIGTRCTGRATVARDDFRLIAMEACNCDVKDRDSVVLEMVADGAVAAPPAPRSIFANCDQVRRFQTGAGSTSANPILMARIAALDARPAEAERILRSVMAQKPADAGIKVHLAELLLSIHGNSGEAGHRHLQEAETLALEAAAPIAQPATARARATYLLGCLRRKLLRSEEEVRAALEGVLTLPLSVDAAPALVELGNLAVLSEDWPKARKFFSDALKADKNSADAHCGLGIVMKNAPTASDNAAVELRAALVINPNHGEAARAYANVLLDQAKRAGTDLSRRAEARETFKRGLQVCLDESDVNLSLGVLDFSDVFSNIDSAETCFRQSIAVGKSPAALDNLVQAILANPSRPEAERPRAAIEAINTLVVDPPLDATRAAELLASVADAAEKAGHCDLAIELYTQSARRNPTLARPAVALSTIFSDRESACYNERNAIEWCVAALQRSAYDSFTLRRLALLLSPRERLDYGKALAAASITSMACYALSAMVLRDHNDEIGAVQCLKRALEIDPSNEYAKAKLIEVMAQLPQELRIIVDWK